ncbi:alkaline phosphatase family protein [Egicoccus sp. AB-alg2]|uniref:alkaline phosphatase family protein n=1 Tax=Egicoccus sp. AB-alg2 TaxID=3242693 RepID=UPI00359D0A67
MTAPALPRAPRYGTASLAELLPAAATVLGGGADALLPWPAGIRGVVVLVADGLGRRQLDAYANLAPFLAAVPGATLDAPFPSTTATSLSSLGTGRPPGEHGIVGFAMRPPDHDRRLVTLTWSWDRDRPVDDARAEVVPEALQPLPTVFATARAGGLQTVTVLQPDFVGSGLTRAALRGGRTETAVGLDATLATALQAVVGTTAAPVLVYAHHAEIDRAGHVAGPGSDAWCAALAALDGTLQRVAADLPGDVALVVTADHGMVATSEAELLEIADDPALCDGVRLLTGEPRARYLHTVEGAAEDVAAAWRERVGARGHVVERDVAIDAGWYGPTVTPRVRRSIGDVVVVADGTVGFVHAMHDPRGGHLAGHHGALTPDELEIPALVVTRSG